MGILDGLTELVNGQGGNIFDQVKKQLTEGGLDSIIDKFPQLQELTKNLNADQLQSLVNGFKENGFPDSMDEIKDIISKFNK